MDRTEATGLGVAAAGHLALLAALSLGFAATRIHPPPQQPIEVSFVEDAAPVSSAPELAPAAPAPRLDEVPGPPEAAPAPPLPAPPQAEPLPAPRPQPTRAAPASVPRAAPAPVAAHPAPPRTAAARPTGRLSGLLAGLASSETKSRSAGAPAATIGPAVKSSLIAEVRRQLKPKWQQVAPSGADVDSLRTELSLTLARDGTVTHVQLVGTSGVNASNKPQVPLHQERARKAVMLASPFRLPADYYDAWKQVNVTLDLRLSQ
jgi:outer membrane biosynthesis protein TonB